LKPFELLFVHGRFPRRAEDTPFGYCAVFVSCGWRTCRRSSTRSIAAAKQGSHSARTCSARTWLDGYLPSAELDRSQCISCFYLRLPLLNVSRPVNFPLPAV
jgi:hypothetical protein